MRRFRFKMVFHSAQSAQRVGNGFAQVAQGGWWHDVTEENTVYVFVECMTEDAARLDVMRWAKLAGFPYVLPKLVSQGDIG